MQGAVGNVEAPNRSLFREEVLEHRADRLHGDVSIAVPLSWHVIGYALLAALAAAFVLLFTASYARVETATGAIVLDKGVAPILAARPGIVTALAVREGQRVRAGEPLVRIRSEAAEGAVLTSPYDGNATAVTARPGQPADPRQPLMMIVPAGAVPRAELHVPTAAAGFLAVGQEVRLAVDAFPYQRFGVATGRIAEISTVAIPKASADGRTAPVYLVTAELDRPWVDAFGRRHALRPGMTLTARIVTERQTLLEWLFEPLFAVASR
jgi:multidrug efflux pump subunit AcrA (membrane-fusion protein)